MTSAGFRRIALALAGAEEKQHMGHPDFRAADKIFGTLGYTSHRSATLMVSHQDQAFLIRDHPKAFKPAPGAWGQSGSTSVLLRVASRGVVSVALEAAWSRRAPKTISAPATPRTPKRRRPSNER